MDKAFEKQLLDLETQFWQALKDADANAALKLTHNPCIVTGAQGVASLSHEQFRGMMASPNWTIVDFSIEDVAVEKLADDVAVIAYKIRETLRVDGEPVELNAADASTWIRKNGAWVCALHTESLTGDPYGRDRKTSVGGT